MRVSAHQSSCVKQSHVAHPSGPPRPDGLQFFGTDCPDSHPIRLPLLFMEIVWDTRQFNTAELWPKDGTQPFVFSMGDPYVHLLSLFPLNILRLLTKLNGHVMHCATVGRDMDSTRTMCLDGRVTRSAARWTYARV